MADLPQTGGFPIWREEGPTFLRMNRLANIAQWTVPVLRFSRFYWRLNCCIILCELRDPEKSPQTHQKNTPEALPTVNKTKSAQWQRLAWHSAFWTANTQKDVETHWPPREWRRKSFRNFDFSKWRIVWCWLLCQRGQVMPSRFIINTIYNKNTSFFYPLLYVEADQFWTEYIPFLEKSYKNQISS